MPKEKKENLDLPPLSPLSSPENQDSPASLAGAAISGHYFPRNFQEGSPKNQGSQNWDSLNWATGTGYFLRQPRNSPEIGSSGGWQGRGVLIDQDDEAAVIFGDFF
ncbi:hypothetical protein PHJA_001848400 [Phtheirospermum japonicum]|uniref:Uncharacterized protein n=1 Tax=Phtheirospermum japonicum TaxID=374723 RepID=A0A830CMJ0_9LAMI|nr:hypothetical protein PHJA_001848400 [Phtheirospermum japonicum]